MSQADPKNQYQDQSRHVVKGWSLFYKVLWLPWCGKHWHNHRIISTWNRMLNMDFREFPRVWIKFKQIGFLAVPKPNKQKKLWRESVYHVLFHFWAYCSVICCFFFSEGKARLLLQRKSFVSKEAYNHKALHGSPVTLSQTVGRVCLCRLSH